MNFLSFLRYAAQWARYPNYRDYLSRGQGIVERRRAARRYWEQHERLCQDFQRSALEGVSGEDVVALGAGHLNDIDLDTLSRCGRRIHLFDIDPGVMRDWKRAARAAARRGVTVKGELRDITGSVVEWTKELQREAARFRNLSECCSFLDALTAKAASLPVANGSIMLSVNVLSQLSVFWRDRLIDALAKYKVIPSPNPIELPAELSRSLERTSRLFGRGASRADAIRAAGKNHSHHGSHVSLL